jgi:hypothetical protein
MGIVLCVLRRFCDSDCPFGIFWPLYCLFFVDLLIPIAPEKQTIHLAKNNKRAIGIKKTTKNKQYKGQKRTKGAKELKNLPKTQNRNPKIKITKH